MNINDEELTELLMKAYEDWVLWDTKLAPLFNPGFPKSRGIVDGLLRLLCEREVGTVCEGIGGDYPQYNGDHICSFGVRQKALLLLVPVLRRQLEALVEGIKGNYRDPEFKEATTKLATVLSRASETIQKLPPD